MDFTGGIIIGAIRTFIGAILPPIRKIYFDQPRIYIVFQFAHSLKRPDGLSSKNDITKPIVVTEGIYHNKLEWEYHLYFRNNSEHTAYNLKIVQPKVDRNFVLNPKLDSLKPLIPNSEVMYHAVFHDYYEGRGKDAMEVIKKGPKHFQDDFIIEYTNAKGTKFYTYFSYSKEDSKKHKFTRKIIPTAPQL